MELLPNIVFIIVANYTETKLEVFYEIDQGGKYTRYCNKLSDQNILRVRSMYR